MQKNTERNSKGFTMNGMSREELKKNLQDSHQKKKNSTIYGR
jgi:hypothetical protein